MTPLLPLALLLLAMPAAQAQTPPPQADGEPVVVTTRAIRARTVIGPGDVVLASGDASGALSDPDEAIGMEARVWLQAGRVVMPEDLGPPALVERNQLVIMRFRRGLLEITAEGRALDRAGAGELVRVMNLDSRSTVTGRVIGPALVEVN